MKKLVDVLGLDMRCQLACCRCSGFLYDGLLDVAVDVETILLHIRPVVDGSIVPAAILDDVATDDAIHDGLADPALDAIPDVDVNHDVVDDHPIHDVAIHDVLVVDGYPMEIDAILQLLLLPPILFVLPIRVSSHPHDVDAIDVRRAAIT